MEEPPDCKYKNICRYYEVKTLWGEGCNELYCYRARALDDYIDLNNLNSLIYNGTKQRTKNKGVESKSL